VDESLTGQMGCLEILHLEMTSKRRKLLRVLNAKRRRIPNFGIHYPIFSRLQTKVREIWESVWVLGGFQCRFPTVYNAFRYADIRH